MVFSLACLHKFVVYTGVSAWMRTSFSLLPVLFLLWVIKTHSKARMAYPVFVRLGLTMTLFGEGMGYCLEQGESNPIWVHSISLCHTMSIFLLAGALIMKYANLRLVCHTYFQEIKDTHDIYSVVRYTMVLIFITLMFLGSVPVGHVFNTLSSFVLVAYSNLVRDTENKIRSKLQSEKLTDETEHVLKNLPPSISYYFLGGILVFTNDYCLPICYRIMASRWPPIIIPQMSLVRAGMNIAVMTLFAVSAVHKSNFELYVEKDKKHI